jgi:leader peptidase (prepilin peptidase)/N-methyltransferase
MSFGMTLFYSFVAIAFGLISGSFFNVLIHRLPKKESIVRPPSHCPHCGRPVKPYENIPVLSYVALRGRCAGCREKISLRYPLVELSTGAAAFLLYWRVVIPAVSGPLSSWLIITLVIQISVLLVLIPITVIDLLHFIIPDSITVPGLLIGILVSFFPGGISPLQCALGIAAGGGTLFIVGTLGEWILKKGEAMGGGDVKLMALCGAVFGWKIALATIILASCVGAGAGAILIAIRVLRKDHKIPFGPFLACGLWISVLYGNGLMSLYQELMDRLIG